MNKIGILLLILFFFFQESKIYAQDLLPPIQKWEGKSLELMISSEDEWATPFEISGGMFSPSYDSTVNWIKKICRESDYLSLVQIGTSAQKRVIYMVLATSEKNHYSQKIRESEKPTILIQAGIHSGEIDGKDAGMMLLRNIAFKGKQRLLNNVNVLFIPILNVDGHERRSRFSRVNQRGPEIMGWRTNSLNLNLNRDYTKIETEGIAALMYAINSYDPDLYLDIHVTDGVDYQHDITYGYAEHGAYSPNISNWLKTFFRSEVDESLERYNHTPGNLIFARNGRDFREGSIEFFFSPRFSNSYGDARHIPTVLVENHSLKPFKQRVLGTYVLIEQSILTLGKHYEELKSAIELDKQNRPDSVIIKYTYAESSTDEINIKGIESRIKTSEITGKEVVEWTGKKKNMKIPVLRMNKPDKKVGMPKFYWIPVHYQNLIDKIHKHGIETEDVYPATNKTLVYYQVDSFKLKNNLYEGRMRIEEFSLSKIEREYTFPEYSIRIKADQDLKELIAILLEPESPDSFFQWGFFNTIFSRTEYIEAYAIEELAKRMLKEDPDLKKEFEEKKANDQNFADSPREIYSWFYSKSLYFDEYWKIIPIGMEY